MALTFDTKLRIPATALTTTTGAASAAYTCGANAKVLVVMVLYASNVQRTGGAPTYNDVALIQVESLAGVTEAACEMWYMLAPPVSQALTVNVPNDNGRTMWVYVASGNAGAGNTCEVDDSGITETTAANPSVSVNTASAGTLIFAVVATGDNTFAPTARTGTSLYEEDIAAYGGAAQYYVMAGTGAQALSWTEATSDDYGAIAQAFKEVPVTLTINKSESIIVTESTGQAVSTPQVNVSDGITVTENRVVELPGAPLSVNVQENITVTDVLGTYYPEIIFVTEWVSVEIVEVTLQVNVSENITVTESITAAVSDPQINKSENITVAESVTSAIVTSIGVSDNIAVTESTELLVTSFIAETENITVTENVVVVVSDPQVNVSENITVTEATQQEIVTTVNVSESIAVTESTGQVVSDAQVNVSDNIAVTESTGQAVSTPQVNVSDNIAVTEAVTASVEEEGVFNVSVSENIAVSESIAVTVSALQINVSETITVSESVTDQITSYITVTESITISETLTFLVVSDVIVADNVTISESTGLVVSDPQISVSDGITVAESVDLSLPGMEIVVGLQTLILTGTIQTLHVSARKDILLDTLVLTNVLVPLVFTYTVSKIWLFRRMIEKKRRNYHYAA